LNPLVAPSTVSTTVTILVEVSAGPDYEVAYPRSISDRPVLVVNPQGGGNNVCEIVSTEIGNSNNRDSLAPSLLCIGERVLSLLQLIRRFSPVNFSGGTKNFFLQFLPWSLPVDFIDGSNNLSVSEFVTVDPVTQISLCYALSRGSMRYKLVEQTPSDSILMYARNASTYNGGGATAALNWQYTATAYPSVGSLGNGENNTLVYSNISGGLELEFPYYSRTFAHGTADAMNNYLATTGLPTYNPGVNTAPRTLALITMPVVPTTGVLAFRAAGEDFSLGLFTSILGYSSWSTAL